MAIQLSDHFDSKRLIRFALPSVAMMIFTSIYGVVDGYFISNFAGKTPFAAVNFIYPFLMILGTFGFMLGTGGSALTAKTFGEGDAVKGNRLFSLFIYATACIGVLIAALSFIFVGDVARLLGADAAMAEHCTVYGRIYSLGLPFYMLQMAFQPFFVAAERPKFGLYTTLAAGITNIILDALFIAVFDWGVAGAAAATVICMVVGALIPLIYFKRPNTSLLHLGKTSWDGRAMLKACTNGSSEMVSNISMSLVSMLYNFQLMRYAGENGVAAYGVLMYVNMIFLAIFIGFSVGTAPITSYHFGANNKAEVTNILRKSSRLILIASLCMFASAQLLATPLSLLFTGYAPDLLAMTEHAFAIFAFAFLFSGTAIYASSFFTALNDGLTSALISFLRTLVFEVCAVLFLPLALGLDGIWSAIVVAEIAAFILSLAFLAIKRKKFGY